MARIAVQEIGAREHCAASRDQDTTYLDVFFGASADEIGGRSQAHGLQEHGLHVAERSMLE